MNIKDDEEYISCIECGDEVPLKYSTGAKCLQCA